MSFRAGVFSAGATTWNLYAIGTLTLNTWHAYGQGFVQTVRIERSGLWDAGDFALSMYKILTNKGVTVISITLGQIYFRRILSSIEGRGTWTWPLAQTCIETQRMDIVP